MANFSRNKNRSGTAARGHATAPEDDTRTLDEALDEASRSRWEGLRCYRSARSGAEIAVKTLKTLRKASRGPAGRLSPLRVCDVTPEMLVALTRHWAAKDISPATVTKRPSGNKRFT
jgi:hypothetical protein